MLVLSRKVDQAFVVGDSIIVRVLAVSGGKVRLGIEAPRDVPIFREELVEHAASKTIVDPFLPLGTNREASLLEEA